MRRRRSGPDVRLRADEPPAADRRAIRRRLRPKVAAKSIFPPRGSSIGLRTLLANPVDRAADVGPIERRRRAAVPIPAARFDHQQAAVGVFQHVGRMKLDVVARQKILVARRVRRPVRLQHVSQHFVAAEQGREQVAAKLRAERRPTRSTSGPPARARAQPVSRGIRSGPVQGNSNTGPMSFG